MKNVLAYALAVIAFISLLTGVILAINEREQHTEDQITRAFIRGVGYGGCAEALRRGDQTCEPRVNEIAIDIENPGDVERYIVLDGTLRRVSGGQARSLPQPCTRGSEDPSEHCVVTFND